jgi:hypothetical protein
VAWQYKSHNELAKAGWLFVSRKACTKCGKLVALYKTPVEGLWRRHIVAVDFSPEYRPHRDTCVVRKTEKKWKSEVSE